MEARRVIDLTKTVMPTTRTIALVLATASLVWWAASDRNGVIAALNVRIETKASKADIVEIKTAIQTLTTEIYKLLEAYAATKGETLR